MVSLLHNIGQSAGDNKPLRRENSNNATPNTLQKSPFESGSVIFNLFSNINRIKCINNS
jgi:hypothetical protein